MNPILLAFLRARLRAPALGWQGIVESAGAFLA